MSETSYADLPELARKLRLILADRAHRRPEQSPFVLLYAFNGTGKTQLFYHVAALADLWQVAHGGQAKTFHFNILRTILEKTALFLGNRHFSACIEDAADDADGILHQRFVDLLSHGKYSMYEPTEIGDETKDYFLTILRGFVEHHPFNREILPEPAEDTEAS